MVDYYNLLACNTIYHLWNNLYNYYNYKHFKAIIILPFVGAWNNSEDLKMDL